MLGNGRGRAFQECSSVCETSAGYHPRWRHRCHLRQIPSGACLQHIQCVVGQLDSWFMDQGQVRTAQYMQRAGRKSLLSLQHAPEQQGRALGSMRAAFKELKEVTVLPGALFLPALTAGKTSEWGEPITPISLFMSPSPHHPSFSLSI